MDKIHDDDKACTLSRLSFSDFTGDNNSDLQVYRFHSDMSESHIWWAWVEGEGYVCQSDDSWFYHSIVVRDPDDYDTAYGYGMYKGIWLSDADNQYDDTYIEFDWEGYWKFYVAGEIVDKGSLRYEPGGDYVYAHSFQDSAIDCGRVELEGDRLYVTNLGSFTNLVGIVLSVGIPSCISGMLWNSKVPGITITTLRQRPTSYSMLMGTGAIISVRPATPRVQKWTAA